MCVFVHGAYTYRRDKSNISIVRRADGNTHTFSSIEGIRVLN